MYWDFKFLKIHFRVHNYEQTENPIYLKSSIYLIEYHYFCLRKGYLSATNPNV